MFGLSSSGFQEFTYDKTTQTYTLVLESPDSNYLFTSIDLLSLKSKAKNLIFSEELFQDLHFKYKKGLRTVRKPVNITPIFQSEDSLFKQYRCNIVRPEELPLKKKIGRVKPVNLKLVFTSDIKIPIQMQVNRVFNN